MARQDQGTEGGFGQGDTEAMVKIAKTPPEATTIVFEDVAKENWAIGGKLASDS